MKEKDNDRSPLWDEEAVAIVTEELRVRLNELVSQYNLTSSDVLATLSRLSAAQIHIMKGFFDSPEQKDAVESLYNKLLLHHLTAFDVRDVQREVERIKRERMN